MAALIFGFEPFQEYDENPSQLVAERLDKRSMLGERVVGHVLPVDHSRVKQEIRSAISEVRPKLVLGFGLAPGRDRLTPERLAVNQLSFEKPDNSGLSIPCARIEPEGPDLLFAKVPVRALVRHLNEAGIPAFLSLSAGTYLCNAAMYIILLEAQRQGFAAGFIHIPCHAEWVKRKGKAQPSLPLETILRGAELALAFCLRHANRRAAAPRAQAEAA